MPVIHSLYRESGRVTMEASLCRHCLACARICPTHVLVTDGKTVRIQPDTPLGCIACGHCMMVCPDGAIRVNGRGLSPEDLAPLPDPDQKATVGQLMALMQSRRSIRRFTEQEVDPAILKQIITMASTAPMGIPPWDIGCVTICGRDQVQQLAREVIQGYGTFLKIFRPWLLTLMRLFVSKAKYDQFAHFVRPLAQSYVQGLRENRDLLFYGAPAVILFHSSPYNDATDAYIPCTYAMLAAESLGLGTTMIGAAAPIIQRNPSLCQRLGIPQGHQPAIALILGYPATRFRHSVQRKFVSEHIISGSSRQESVSK